MPFDYPSLSDLREQARDFIVARLPGEDADVPNSVLRVLSDAEAGLAFQVLLHQAWMARQFLPDTADGDILDRFGTIWVGGRKAATFAEGSVALTGIAGTIVPTGTQLAAGSFLFETTEAATIGSTLSTAPVRALTAGSGSNLAAGTALGVLTAVAGVDSAAAVIQIDGGISEESDDSLRDRVLTRIRKPPQGGAAYDYVAWARAVPGVTRAWAAQEAGLGTVTVRFMMDDDRQDGLPNADDVQAVADYIGARRPVTVSDTYVVTPIPQPISFRISGLSRSTTSTIANIEASVRDMLRQRSAPGQPIYRSWIDEAISRAAGEDFHELSFATTAAISPGHLPVLGTISYGP